VADNLGYICAETLAERLDLLAELPTGNTTPVELLEGIATEIQIIPVQ
jgi:hypothetical protein